ncbi:hypothetical protein [Arabiibacter massiliensis]|uniref:hypothetical protein n=1 Tax=Arabiibacter massiliensis TaxID=1870985 RepID=UPI00117B2889|nr:hypothetical protein [Arabiibacter massiliensis]
MIGISLEKAGDPALRLSPRKMQLEYNTHLPPGAQDPIFDFSEKVGSRAGGWLLKKHMNRQYGSSEKMCGNFGAGRVAKRRRSAIREASDSGFA